MLIHADCLDIWDHERFRAQAADRPLAGEILVLEKRRIVVNVTTVPDFQSRRQYIETDNENRKS